MSLGPWMKPVGHKIPFPLLKIKENVELLTNDPEYNEENPDSQSKFSEKCPC